MAHPIANRFTEFEFNQLEFYAATRFSELNLMLLQTLVAQTALEKVNLTIDPNDAKCIQREAELQGTMRAYEHLLLLATETEVPLAPQEQETVVVPTPKQGAQS